MSNRFTNISAVTLLVIMFFLAVFSIKDDTFTFDETAHIAAGYSYLTQKDYRLNPEHPPLVKDLAAFTLLFLNLNFPKDEPSWTQEAPPPWWAQFDFASQFLYHSGNNPDQILFWSRLPMILLLLFLGWFLFYSTKKLFGNKTALIALFFFSFSPTFLAHGRLVTTDVGASLGVILSTYFWLKFLKNPAKKNVFFAGIIFGIAMLLKFSLITLIPFFGLITIIYAWFFAEKKPLVEEHSFFSTLRCARVLNVLRYVGRAILIGIVGSVFIIWPVYFYHTFNYPPQQQIRDTQFLLSTTSVPKILSEIDVWLVKSPVLRPFGHYTLGLLLAVNRSTTGNTTFFLGQVSAEGWKSYFPVVYSIKEPLAFHILTIIVLLYAAWLFRKPLWHNTWQRARDWIKAHFPEFTLFSFIAIYWLTSITAKLNIGVRHLLPVFPFIIILVAYVLSLMLKRPYLKAKYVILGALFLWQALSVVSVYPHFLAYFNELAGGPNNGYLYAVDSNLDWGQDLKRLTKWINDYNCCVDEQCRQTTGNMCYKFPSALLKTWESPQPINKIFIDYFGGGNTEYYLGKKFAPWWGTRNPEELPKGSWLAVSASQLQGGRGVSVKGYDGPVGFYRWLDAYTPIAKIGYSIFIYKID